MEAERLDGCKNDKGGSRQEELRELYRCNRTYEKYILKHPEVIALASLFISHSLKKTTNCCSDEAASRNSAIFFTRPMSVLKQEVEQHLARTGKRPRIMAQLETSTEDNRLGNARVKSSFGKESEVQLQPHYSSFMSVDTSTTTVQSNITEEIPPSTLSEHVMALLNHTVNAAFNKTVTDTDVIKDSAYLAIVECSGRAVTEYWVEPLKIIYTFIEDVYRNVSATVAENKRVRNIEFDKTFIKVERLKDNYRGFAKASSLIITENDIEVMLKHRQCKYNRYSKDLFGAYRPVTDHKYDNSSTWEPYIPQERAMPAPASTPVLSRSDVAAQL